MDQHDQRRIEDVRGEPMDELRFLSHLLKDRLQDTLPPEFWQHARLARKEMRAALLILLRAAIDHLARENAEGETAPVSAQRGKINLDITATDPPPSPNGVPLHTADERYDATPSKSTRTSRQRVKIALE